MWVGSEIVAIQVVGILAEYHHLTKPCFSWYPAWVRQVDGIWHGILNSEIIAISVEATEKQKALLEGNESWREVGGRLGLYLGDETVRDSNCFVKLFRLN